MSCRQKERWVLSSELQPNLWNLQLPMLIFGHTLCRNKGPRTAASPRRASLHFPKFLMLLLLLLFHLRYTLVIITHHFQDLKTNNLLYLVLVLLVSWVHECICCRHPPSFHPALRHKGTIGGPTVQPNAAIVPTPFQTEWPPKLLQSIPVLFKSSWCSL